MKLGIYQHYKGKLYKVLLLAKDTETLEEMVVYECLYENPQGQFWTRNKLMFEEKILIDNKEVQRFTFIRPSVDI